jgi:hypothetical protein
MSKYNVSTLFDGMFTKTASKLMSKTKIGKVRIRQDIYRTQFTTVS